MKIRISLVSVLAALAFVGTVQGDVFVEDWNDSLLGNNDWQYWVDSVDTTSTRPADAGENRDMKWSPWGGVNDSGYVWSPGSELHKTEVLQNHLNPSCTSTSLCLRDLLTI